MIGGAGIQKASLRVFVLIFCVLILMATTGCVNVSSDKKQQLSEMSEDECIEFIKSKGIEIPDEFNNDKLGIFVKKTIIAMEKNPDQPILISYTVTRKFMEDIKEAVNEYYNRNE